MEHEEETVEKVPMESPMDITSSSDPVTHSDDYPDPYARESSIVMDSPTRPMATRQPDTNRPSSTLPNISDSARNNRNIADMYMRGVSRESGIGPSMDSDGYTTINGSGYGSRYDVDNRYRQDILRGLEYFEDRNREMQELNHKLVQDLNRFMTHKTEMEASLDKQKGINNQFLHDNNDLQLKIDTTDKENMRLHEQAISEWHSRVKVEEICVEQQVAYDNEIKNLKELLAIREAEIVELKSALEAAKIKAKPNRDNEIELVGKVNRLQEELSKVTKERNNERERNIKFMEKNDTLKKRLETTQAELERQINRFLSLKKSFNDLSDEKEKLKELNKNRRNSVGGSNTWPSNHPGNEAVSETLHYVDLPNKEANMKTTLPVPGKGVVASKVVKGHRKQPSGSRSPDSLPPVNKDGRK